MCSAASDAYDELNKELDTSMLERTLSEKVSDTAGVSRAAARKAIDARTVPPATIIRDRDWA